MHDAQVRNYGIVHVLEKEGSVVESIEGDSVRTDSIRIANS